MATSSKSTGVPCTALRIRSQRSGSRFGSERPSSSVDPGPRGVISSRLTQPVRTSPSASTLTWKGPVGVSRILWRRPFTEVMVVGDSGHECSHAGKTRRSSGLAETPSRPSRAPLFTQGFGSSAVRCGPGSITARSRRRVRSQVVHHHASTLLLAVWSRGSESAGRHKLGCKPESDGGKVERWSPGIPTSQGSAVRDAATTSPGSRPPGTRPAPFNAPAPSADSRSIFPS